MTSQFTPDGRPDSETDARPTSEAKAIARALAIMGKALWVKGLDNETFSVIHSAISRIEERAR